MPFSWVKICGPIKSQLPGYPQSGLKAMSREGREKKKEDRKVIVNNGEVNAWTDNSVTTLSVFN